MSLLCCAITKPGIATVSKHAFNSAPVEHNHGWDGKIHLPQSAERVAVGLSMTALVLSLEVISSVRWTPRNLTGVPSLPQGLIGVKRKVVLYADSLLLVMRPTTVVSSGNFMI